MNGKFITSDIDTEDLIQAFDEKWQRILGLNKNTVFREELDKIKNDINALTLKNIRLAPGLSKIFNAFNELDLSNFRVLIVCGESQPFDDANNGMVFSRTCGRITNDLHTILESIDQSYGTELVKEKEFNGNLMPWANKGVLLLNLQLTVNSNRKRETYVDWEKFLGKVVGYLDHTYTFVSILMGIRAWDFGTCISNNSEFIIRARHPYSKAQINPFIKSEYFLECNKKLIDLGLLPINWKY